MAPVGVAIATPGLASAATDPSGTPGDNSGGGTGGGVTDPSGTGNDPGAGGGSSPTVHKNVIRLPGLKIEIKNTVGDHKPPTIKFVPFPRLR